MKTDYTDLMDVVRFKDVVNSYKESHKLSVKDLTTLLKNEVEEFEEAYPNERKADALLELADIVVFAGLLFNKIKQERRK